MYLPNFTEMRPYQVLQSTDYLEIIYQFIEYDLIDTGVDTFGITSPLFEFTLDLLEQVEAWGVALRLSEGQIILDASDIEHVVGDDYRLNYFVPIGFVPFGFSEFPGYSIYRIKAVYRSDVNCLYPIDIGGREISVDSGGRFWSHPSRIESDIPQEITVAMYHHHDEGGLYVLPPFLWLLVSVCSVLHEFVDGVNRKSEVASALGFPVASVSSSPFHFYQAASEWEKNYVDSGLLNLECGLSHYNFTFPMLAACEWGFFGVFGAAFSSFMASWLSENRRGWSPFSAMYWKFKELNPEYYDEYMQAWRRRSWYSSCIVPGGWVGDDGIDWEGLQAYCFPVSNSSGSSVNGDNRIYLISLGSDGGGGISSGLVQAARFGLLPSLRVLRGVF